MAPQPRCNHLRLAVHLDDHGPADQHGQRRLVRRQHRGLREPAVRLSTTARLAGETVVEAVFGASSNVVASANFANIGGYGAGADRTVLLRWFATQPDPVVKVGDWIADVTYERSQMLVNSRFYSTTSAAAVGVPNPLNNCEWDNLPAQRCFWYQVQRVTPAQPDPSVWAAPIDP